MVSRHLYKLGSLCSQMAESMINMHSEGKVDRGASELVCYLSSFSNVGVSKQEHIIEELVVANQVRQLLDVESYCVGISVSSAVSAVNVSPTRFMRMFLTFQYSDHSRLTKVCSSMIYTSEVKQAVSTNLRSSLRNLANF